MHRVFCVQYTKDSKYVLSGSEDTNLRIWKAKASEPAGVLLPREKRKIQYSEKLLDRYGELPDVRKIHSKRHIPKMVLNLRKQKVIREFSRKRKERNVALHSGKKAPKQVPEVKQYIEALET
eukprot:TRINITY_DN3796_c0_g1_i1.p2 TRINITY_DN3796_c0_g1~~TRINITY_DN3796_c0_g1_i1.p2  ORF type:complete len:122 (-),score=18.93 TRINITY_DN3796_c0_g1_i1:10-375(-)